MKAYLAWTRRVRHNPYYRLANVLAQAVAAAFGTVFVFTHNAYGLAASAFVFAVCAETPEDQ